MIVIVPRSKQRAENGSYFSQGLLEGIATGIFVPVVILAITVGWLGVAALLLPCVVAYVGINFCFQKSYMESEKAHSGGLVR